MYVCMSKLGGVGFPEREIFLGRASAKLRVCALSWADLHGRDFFFFVPGVLGGVLGGFLLK